MELDNIVVTKLFDVMTIPIYGNTSKQIKNRYGYGLTFCATPGGKIIYELDGKSYISDYNHGVLLPMGRTYMLNGISTGEFPLINFYTENTLNKCNFAVFELNTPGYYLNTYEQIKELCRYDRPFCSARAMSLMYEMLSHLMVNSDGENPILSKAVAYIENNYSNPELTIEDVADHVKVSAGYLRKLFSEKYSFSPKKYMLNARIHKAKELLLRSTSESVTNISNQCGFTNIYHFDRVFRSFTGFSPTEYMQRFANKL